MDSKIYIILIGVITLTNGKPTHDEPNILVADENELQQLLKTLYSNGKFDISFSHHEDGPQTHHEDQARITPHDDHSHELHHHQEESRHSHDKTRSSYDEARSSHDERHHHGSHKHTSIHKNPSLTNIQNVNLIYKKKPSDNNYDEDVESVIGLKTKNSEDNSVAQLLEVLKNYDNNVGNVGNVGRTSNDNRDDDCGGGRCGRSDDRNDDNVRLCIGDRCGYGRAGPDDNDKNSENNGNNGNQILDLLEGIVKNEGNVGKVDRASNDNRDDDCGGNRCGCGGGRCGYGRGDNDNDDRGRAEDEDSDYIKDIMRADRDRRISESDSYVEQQIKSNAHRYKISDELDAIVVDMSGLQNSLGNSNANDQNERLPISNMRLIENVGYPNVLENGNDDSEEQVKRHDVLDSDSKPIKAVVVDLSKSEVDLRGQLEDLLKNVQVKSNKDRISNKDEEESKIMTHNLDNNNVYVPKWLLDEIVPKNNYLRADSEVALKHLLPMTAKQKQKIVKAIAIKNSNASKRIFRRSVEDDIGVPFHLKVEGLGQVNP